MTSKGPKSSEHNLISFASLEVLNLKKSKEDIPKVQRKPSFDRSLKPIKPIPTGNHMECFKKPSAPSLSDLPNFATPTLKPIYSNTNIQVKPISVNDVQLDCQTTEMKKLCTCCDDYYHHSPEEYKNFWESNYKPDPVLQYSRMTDFYCDYKRHR